MSRRIKNQRAITALYCRLPIEDGRDNESMSISNQKAMLKDFAEKNGLYDFKYYDDDGYIDRNFNRPTFQRMIADIEDGKVKRVVTKDLSRLGRNYIEAGSYIEVFFPRHNVRYIAVTDGVDSLNRRRWTSPPLKTSSTTCTAATFPRRYRPDGAILSGKVGRRPSPYGLKRDSEDHGHLIIAPETAPTARSFTIWRWTGTAA